MRHTTRDQIQYSKSNIQKIFEKSRKFLTLLSSEGISRIFSPCSICEHEPKLYRYYGIYWCVLFLQDLIFSYWTMCYVVLVLYKKCRDMCHVQLHAKTVAHNLRKRLKAIINYFSFRFFILSDFWKYFQSSCQCCWTTLWVFQRLPGD